ncbi:type I restriction-modification system subunit M N-terminal domain-containing protein [Acidithiobacillus ferrivorans]|uniref:type I restriction-modification system subunit M N-terminal domain-containing protein n=1 Tax=Acidithiobacillus ferrivorans TaxID=160808 RepID=UPI0027962D0F|nr:type I restriction-modification system subunit M N-terminal domain-containing protein [Acidithiobacillus ferrivorans]
MECLPCLRSRPPNQRHLITETSGNPIPLKKSEPYATLWKSCDELRGGMDAAQYKNYVLVLLVAQALSFLRQRLKPKRV